MDRLTGVLLVNLGTPVSPAPRDVYRYLIEFLTDPRVVDFPWLKRQLLVRGLIVPTRYRQSAASYKQIWTSEGSPLLVYGHRVKKLLQQALGDRFCVELAMRYQQPSIKDGLKRLMERSIDHLIVLPLFPHYASATTGSVHQRVQEELCAYDIIPEVSLVKEYATHPALISAFCSVASKESLAESDHVLFSFHGLPERQIRKADHMRTCLVGSCCDQQEKKSFCYKARCHATAQAIASQLELPSKQYSICFQSRLGKEPWLQPYASDVIKQLAREGKQRVMVFCPSFVCDCLETTFEIGVEYANEFVHAGGKQLELVPGLNEHPAWIKTLQALVLERKIKN